MVFDVDGNHFKVISTAVFDSYIWFYFFSSDEGTWRAKKLDSSPGYSLHSFPHQFSKPVKSLFFKGAIHWPLPEHLLIFQLQDMFCKLIQLPIANSCISIKEEDQYIWEFEGCQVSGGNKNDIWVLYMEEDNYVVGNQQSFDWQQKHSVVLLPQSSVTECPRQLSPFAFNGEFQILYLWRHGSVFSYNLVTRKQEAAYACAWEGKELPSYDPSIKYSSAFSKKLKVKIPVLYMDLMEGQLFEVPVMNDSFPPSFWPPGHYLFNCFRQFSWAYCPNIIMFQLQEEYWEVSTWRFIIPEPFGKVIKAQGL
ncbi:hypothetical protein ACLOJK_009542 [Asimina triloba]